MLVYAVFGRLYDLNKDAAPCRYVNTTENDLDYWGLDYPPVTAYQVGMGWDPLPGRPDRVCTVQQVKRTVCAELAVWQGHTAA